MLHAIIYRQAYMIIPTFPKENQLKKNLLCKIYIIYIKIIKSIEKLQNGFVGYFLSNKRYFKILSNCWNDEYTQGRTTKPSCAHQCLLKSNNMHPRMIGNPQNIAT